MINKDRLKKIEEAIARAKAEKEENETIDLSGISDEELMSKIEEGLADSYRDYPDDLSDQQWLEVYALTHSGYTFEEAIANVRKQV